MTDTLTRLAEQCPDLDFLLRWKERAEHDRESMDHPSKFLMIRLQFLTDMVEPTLRALAERLEKAEEERDSVLQACADAGWHVNAGDPEGFIRSLARRTESKPSHD